MDTPTQELLATGLVQDPGAIPLVIGVAGHRDPRPEDLPRLRDRFREVISEILQALPHTPLLLLNGLAAGMDSEAAEVFLDLMEEQRQLRPDGPQHQLVAALPKPRLLFLEEDFRLDDKPESEFNRNRLQRLLAACNAVLDGDNCPDLSLPEPGGGLWRDPRDPRCYGRQGVFLARHCYLLVAFSNGLDSGKVGGTSQTLAMQRGELYPLFVQVDEVIAAREPGVVVEITTPRTSDAVRPCPVATVRFWGENLDGSRIDGNAVAKLEKQALKELLNGMPRRLEEINEELPDCPPKDKYQSGVQSRSWIYADKMAFAEKQKYIRQCRIVMVASVVVALSTSQQNWQAVGMLMVLAAVVVFPKLQNSPKLKFIQWRCLAECLLVTDLWAAAGVSRDTADLFHSQTNQNFAWIRNLLRARRLQLMALHSDPECRPPFPEVIECSRRWIRDQEDWLRKTIMRQQRLNRNHLRCAGLCFFIAAVLAMSYLGGIHSINQLWPDLFLGGTAAFFGYSELMGYGDTNARYGRSRAQFARASRALESAKADPHDPAMLETRRRLVLEAVGCEKIDELNDWVGDQLQRVYRPAG